MLLNNVGRLVTFLRLTPRPDNKYLVALSTPHGLMQHTMYNLPDPEHGYATDDNARALIVSHLWKNEDRANALLMQNLEAAYLRFLKFTQTPEGTFYCYVSFDLKKKRPGRGDWFGRSIFALAFLLFHSKKYSAASWKMLKKSLLQLYDHSFSIRTKSFIILGLYYLLKHHDKTKLMRQYEVDRIKRILRKWRDELYKLAKANCTDDWYWPENKLTYDNGKVIQAYYLIGYILEDAKMTAIAEKMLQFYIKMTFKRGYFQAPGNHGFWNKNGKRPKYDEQGVEAYSLTSALVTAYKINKHKRYLTIARDVYRWFWGKNRLTESLVHTQSGAVFDALEKDKVNDNQGAESFLALHLAYFALTHKLHL